MKQRWCVLLSGAVVATLMAGCSSAPAPAPPSGQQGATAKSSPKPAAQLPQGMHALGASTAFDDDVWTLNTATACGVTAGVAARWSDSVNSR